MVELREGNLVSNLEDLMRSASLAATDIQQLQTEVQPSLFDSLGLHKRASAVQQSCGV